MTWEIIWAAGIIDGEGCIWINKKRPMLEVTNTNENIIKVLKSKFGGYIYEDKRKDRPNNKKCWKWRVTGLRAIEVLLSVNPYLIGKREKANLILSGFN